MQLDSPLIRCSTSVAIAAHLNSLKYGRAMVRFFLRSCLFSRKTENQAVARFNCDEFEVAKSHYLHAAYIALGNSPKIPIEATGSGGGSQWRIYARLDAMSKLLLLGFYIGIARCSKSMGILDEVGN